MRVTGEALRNFFLPLLDFVFPPICLVCQGSLDTGDRHICPACLSGIPRIHKSHPLFLEALERFAHCQSVSGVVSVFVFEKEGPLQVLAHALKYSGFTTIGIMLGEEVGKRMLELNVRGDVLIPVPLHRIRERERGFNQAEMIARGISTRTGIPVQTSLIRRKKNTKSQTTLNQEERNSNVAGAFEVPGNASTQIAGKRCVIVDDIITTGATIKACADSIALAGAQPSCVASCALAE